MSNVKNPTGFNEALARFSKILKAKELKYTRQREIILRAIAASKSHFIPEELRSKVVSEFGGAHIGSATVYRTLALLEEAGIVTSVSFGASGKRYEFGLKAHHDHMICNACGKMIEFVDDEIENRQKAIAASHGFKIISHAMQIHGLCKGCQKAEN
ncbi:MAG: transcriptional repressor [Helicobacteraceae bacterium]|jgi:Fur family ferric uptake transcriptional regulator|nr:transcriptional repressor [Helicobacteraceae bacterium]